MATTQTRPTLTAAEAWRERASRDVTIVVPAFRNVLYLPSAIESALHAPAAAVLIADDACGEAERRVFARFAARHGSRLGIVASDRRRGIAANLNEAVRRVRTPYFVRLDCDDVLYPGHVEASYRLLAERPDIAAVAGREHRIAGEEHLEFRPGALPAYQPDPHPRFLRGVEAFRFALEWRPNPCSSGTLYRTAAFHDVGGFNPEVPWGEDWEIWFRFALRWALAYVDAPSCLYRIHEGATTSIYARENRLCYGYDYMYRRAAALCPYPDLDPQFRRAFVKVARLYAGAALRLLRRRPAESAGCCRRSVCALAAALAA